MRKLTNPFQLALIIVLGVAVIVLAFICTHHSLTLNPQQNAQTNTLPQMAD